MLLLKKNIKRALIVHLQKYLYWILQNIILVTENILILIIYLA